MGIPLRDHIFDVALASHDVLSVAVVMSRKKVFVGDIQAESNTTSHPPAKSKNKKEDQNQTFLVLAR